jgi:hypothetical protein
VRALSFISLAAAAIACSPAKPAPIAFAFPTDPSAGTELLIIENGAEVHGFAIALEDMTYSVPLSLTNADTAQLEALIYTDSPDVLKLKEGPIAPVKDGSPTRAPDHVYGTTVTNGNVGAWQIEPAESPNGKRYEPALSCIDFDAMPFYGSETGYVGSTAIDSKSALIVAASATVAGYQYFRVDMHGMSKMGDLIPGIFPRRMLTLPNGEIWISGIGPHVTGEVLFSGDPVRGFVERAPRPAGPTCSISAMDYDRSMPQTSTVTPLYLIDSCGNIDRHDKSGWTRLRSSGNQFFYFQKMAWVGPDQLIILSNDGTHVLLFQNGNEAMETTDVPIDSVMALATINGLGTFAGLVSGWVLMRDVPWKTFRGPFIATVGVASFAGFGGNLFIGGTDGDIQQFVGSNACPNVTYVGINSIVSNMIPVDFGIIASGLQYPTPNEVKLFAAVLSRKQ